VADKGLRIEPPPDFVAGHLARLHEVCFAPLPETPWSAHAFRTLLRLPTTRALIACANDQEISGLLVARVAGYEAEILTLCVAPAMRREGVAGALLGQFFEMLEPDTRTLLEVAVDNVVAISLYESFGFTPVGRRPGYYGGPTGGTDAVVYALGRRASDNAPCG
tara:strand:- start:3738 stop:4229 length:492 start_codon:yes stop_codon:yes gene_type:complete